MAFATETTQILQWVALAALILALAGLVYRLVVVCRNAKKEKQIQKQKEIQQAIDDGVEQRLMEIRNEYFVMPRNVIQAVGPDGQIRQGKYLLKSAVEGQPTFNVRLNGLVQQLNDGQVIYLATDDTICPVSEAVLIKPVVD